ncbi:MAG TPA: hypothetical protein PKE39_16830 [Ignavibacteria bacterium]|nr:hypothetical protein [Ignavibacteria bacterium]HMR00691.1 hypothetical protein [Ignavibacteria bacterium]
MKKLLLILILASFNIGFAQMLPKDFKISNDVYKKFKSDVKQNKGNNLIGRFSSSPVSSQTIISNFISDIIVVSNDGGDTIWFGTGKGISRTTNRGLSFQNFYGTEPFGEDDVSGLAVYKNWVVVATAYSQLINEEYVPTGTGIKVSSDYGATWASYPQPIDGVNDSTIQYGISTITALPVVVDEFNLSYDIAISKKNSSSDSLVFWITSWAGGTRKSTDFGATWQRVVLPPDAFNTITPTGGPYNFELNPRDPPLGNNNHKGFSVTTENDSTIYVGTANGINRSSDWGMSWKKYNFDSTGTGSGVSGDFVVGLDVQKYGNNVIVWASSNPTKGGEFSAFSFSSNFGASWSNTLDVAFTHNVGFKDSIVYGATDDGIWRSYFTPPGFSWSRPSIIYDEEIRDQIRTNLFYAVDSQGDSVWVGSGDGLARTTDTLTSPWVGKWKIFRAYQNITATNESYAAPNPFSPDDEVCRIYYKTGKTSSNITIKIFDFAMFPIRTVIQNASRTSPDVIWATWDGKRDDGTQVSNGVYFYRIQIDKDETVWGKILVLQ